MAETRPVDHMPVTKAVLFAVRTTRDLPAKPQPATISDPQSSRGPDVVQLDWGIFYTDIVRAIVDALAPRGQVVGVQVLRLE